MRLLGLREGFDEEELVRAYRAACLTHHPDKPGGTNAMFVRVQRARELLSAGASRDGETQEGGCASETFEALKFFMWLLVCVLRTRSWIKYSEREREVRVSVTFEELYDARIKRIEYTRRGRAGEYVREVLFLELCAYQPEYTIPNKGDFGGPLRLFVDVVPDPNYRVDNLETPCTADLHRRVSVSLFEYYYGVTSRARLPNGEEIGFEGAVPRRDGVVTVVSNRGLVRESGARGDLYVVFEVDLDAHDPPAEARDRVRELFSVRSGVARGRQGLDDEPHDAR